MLSFINCSKSFPNHLPCSMKYLIDQDNNLHYIMNWNTIENNHLNFDYLTLQNTYIFLKMVKFTKKATHLDIHNAAESYWYLLEIS